MDRPHMPKNEVEPFLAGLPALYQERHTNEEVQVHARISAARTRASAVVAVDLCPGPSLPSAGGVWLCVVADDRPGLLSLVSAALSAHSLDILSARVYSRRRIGLGAEAIDVFAVRPLGPPGLAPAPDVASIRRSIEALLRGETDVASLEKHAAETSRPSHSPPTSVYFADVRHADVLVVETRDRPGLLLAITLALHRAGVSIVRSNVTTFAGVARDEFEVVDVEGTRISGPLREVLLGKVREVLDPA